MEMYLKAGLAKVYVGCPEPLFDRDVKLFSHNLRSWQRRSPSTRQHRTERISKRCATWFCSMQGIP